MTDPIIEVSDVTKSYGARRALDRVTLSIADGEIVALLGPNGGGKTTLFGILATLLQRDSGRVRVCGHDPAAGRACLRRLLGVVFQSPSLDKKLTAAENLKHHGHLFGLRGPELRRRVDDLLSRLGISDRARDLVETLSGGLARRVEIAKGIIHGPRVLLLDEPSTGLDPAARRELWQQLVELRRDHNLTVLMTTHVMDESERCDRVAILDQGRLVADAPPEQLKARVGGDVINIEVADQESAANRIRTELSLPATVVGGRVRIETPDGAHWIPRLAAALRDQIDSITLGHPTLEDAFIHITGHQFRSEVS